MYNETKHIQIKLNPVKLQPRHILHHQCSQKADWAYSAAHGAGTDAINGVQDNTEVWN